jgi:hypothetical protein
MVLTAVPFPSVLHINGQAYDVDEDTIDLEFSNPGAYRLKLICWPYLDGEWVIHV